MFGNLMGCGCGQMDGIKEPTAFVSVRKGEIKGSNIIIPYNCVTLKRQDHEMSFGIPWNQQQPHGCKSSRYDGGQYKHKDMNMERVEQKAAYYKPINGPKCSQCKKRFKPEKLHSHMKSCKGVKTSVKVDNQHVESTIPCNIHLEKSIHKTFNIE